MNREVHARFCGNIGVKLPGVTRLGVIIIQTLEIANQMETVTTIVSFILFIALIAIPILIIRRLNKVNINYKFITYLIIGIVTTALLTITFAWWSATSNKMLLAHYGYNIDGMNESEIYGKVDPENMEQVKSLKTSVMGIGWPLKAIIMYVVCFFYILIIYFVNKPMQMYKRRTTPNTSG